MGLVGRLVVMALLVWELGWFVTAETCEGEQPNGRNETLQFNDEGRVDSSKHQYHYSLHEKMVAIQYAQWCMSKIELE